MRSVLCGLVIVLAGGEWALGENTDYITYTLQLGGTPGSPIVPFDTATVVEPTDYVYQLCTGDTVLTWSVRVTAGGARGPDGAEVPIGGVAGLAFDLVLKDRNGTPVGPAFGLGSPLSQGFFSVVQNGDLGFPLQAAAFPWVFDVFEDSWHLGVDEYPAPPFGRLIDPSGWGNGPNMSDYSYPSTYGFPEGSTAPSGMLVGMRAAYANFDFNDGAAERGGVGMNADNGSGCYQNIGNRPIAEGQINMRGLPCGRYSLTLLPRAGNSVLLGDISCDAATAGTTGEFAAPATTVTGSTISFFAPCGDPSALAVYLAPQEAITAGCTWSVDDGAALLSGDIILGLAGPHTVFFHAANGWIAPDPVSVLLFGIDYVAVGPDVRTTFVPIPPSPWNGDLDMNGHVDNEDFMLFVGCFSGPGVSFVGDCQLADLDHDWDVDQDDFGVFQRCFAGPEDPPACAP